MRTKPPHRRVFMQQRHCSVSPLRPGRHEARRGPRQPGRRSSRPGPRRPAESRPDSSAGRSTIDRPACACTDLPSSTTAAAVTTRASPTTTTFRVLATSPGATACPSRIRCQAATGSWTKARQWETERTSFSSARATMCRPAKGNGVWPFNDAWLRTSLEEARRQAPRNGASILDSARELGIRDAQPVLLG